jgi:hypothetical protein
MLEVGARWSPTVGARWSPTAIGYGRQALSTQRKVHEACVNLRATLH